MKTKFFLHGGNTSNDSSFWQNMVAMVRTMFSDSEEIKILIIPFSIENEKGFDTETYTIMDRLNKFNINLKGAVKTAMRDPEVFREQLKDSNLIFVSGGNGHMLKYRLTSLLPVDELREIVKENKVIAGVSAGANIWTRNHWSNLGAMVVQGLGFVDIDLIPHYTPEEKIEAEMEISKLNSGYELIKLSDYEYKVFEMNQG